MPFILIVLISCGSAPQSGTTPSEAPAPLPETASAETPLPAEEEAFDPASISQERFDSTKVDVQQFISSLSKIISGKNFNAWKNILSEEYFTKISSPDFLKVTSDQPALKTRKIELKTTEDYFTNVVVPSRANDHVEDIEFVSPTRVKAYTINNNGQRLRLYDLEKIGSNWIIIN